MADAADLKSDVERRESSNLSRGTYFVGVFMAYLNVVGMYYVKQITTEYGVYNADTGINICYYVFNTLNDAKQFIENANWQVASPNMLGIDNYTKVLPKSINKHTYMFISDDGLVIALIKIQIFTDNFYIVENL